MFYSWRLISCHGLYSQTFVQSFMPVEKNTRVSFNLDSPILFKYDVTSTSYQIQHLNMNAKNERSDYLQICWSSSSKPYFCHQWISRIVKREVTIRLSINIIFFHHPNCHKCQTFAKREPRTLLFINKNIIPSSPS